MLPASHRLRSSRDIARVIRRGRALGTAAFSIKYLSRIPSDAPLRVAVVVGLKIDKRATRRNLLKRRIREALRTLLPRLQMGFDVMIFPRAILAQEDYTRICSELETIFKRARLMRSL